MASCLRDHCFTAISHCPRLGHMKDIRLPSCSHGGIVPSLWGLPVVLLRCTADILGRLLLVSAETE